MRPEDLHLEEEEGFHLEAEEGHQDGEERSDHHQCNQHKALILGWEESNMAWLGLGDQICLTFNNQGPNQSTNKDPKVTVAQPNHQKRQHNEGCQKTDDWTPCGTHLAWSFSPPGWKTWSLKCAHTDQTQCSMSATSGQERN